MPAAHLQARAHVALTDARVDQMQPWHHFAQIIAVHAAQGRTGQDDTALRQQGRPAIIQPRPAHFIRQGFARRHMRNVVRRMQIIRINEIRAKSLRQCGTQRGLARPGYAHHNDPH